MEQTHDELTQLCNLTWLPWVGKEYFECKTRFLIIGDRHYLDPYKPEDNPARLKDDYTQRVIGEDVMYGEYYGNTTFPNLLRAIKGDGKFDQEQFWNRVAYHNIIQRPMSSIFERPRPVDYIKGWEVLFELLDILKPDVCLFNGITAANYIANNYLAVPFYEYTIFKGDAIDKSYPRIMNIYNEDGSTIKCVFIQNSARYFPAEKWYEFLNRELGAEFALLK